MVLCERETFRIGTGISQFHRGLQVTRSWSWSGTETEMT
jgi:hypothetical protein